jgi:hypothetical protein
MQRIRFERREFRDNDRTSGVRVIIDGRDLAEMVRDVELPFATRGPFEFDRHQYEAALLEIAEAG